jgi:hypothetical protein
MNNSLWSETPQKIAVISPQRDELLLAQSNPEKRIEQQEVQLPRDVVASFSRLLGISPSALSPEQTSYIQADAKDPKLVERARAGGIPISSDGSIGAAGLVMPGEGTGPPRAYVFPQVCAQQAAQFGLPARAVTDYVALQEVTGLSVGRKFNNLPMAELAQQVVANAASKDPTTPSVFDTTTAILFWQDPQRMGRYELIGTVMRDAVDKALVNSGLSLDPKVNFYTWADAFNKSLVSGQNAPDAMRAAYIELGVDPSKVGAALRDANNAFVKDGFALLKERQGQ